MGQGRLLSITEVGEVTGLPSSALRYYENEGLIASAARVGGRRHFDPSVIRRLRVIALLQEAGFTIGEIGELFGRRGRGWTALADEKLAEIDAHLERVQRARTLLQAARDCGCSDLETCGLVNQKRGRHHQAVQTLRVGFGTPRE